jgi:hypothetical protein
MTCLCMHREEMEVEVWLQPIRNPVLEGGGCSGPCSGLFRRRQTPYTLFKRLGGIRGRSGQYGKFRAPTGIRSPDNLAIC